MRPCDGQGFYRFCFIRNGTHTFSAHRDHLFGWLPGSAFHFILILLRREPDQFHGRNVRWHYILYGGELEEEDGLCRLLTIPLRPLL